MREIKFRAWLKKKNKMVDVKSIHLGTKKVMYGYSINSQNYGNETCKFEDCEIMQYTGLKDKNGTKIFEGDILKGSWFTVFVVYYDDCYLQYRGKYKFGDNEISYYGNSEKLEVIGNIYDNPELLEVQNELRETND